MVDLFIASMGHMNVLFFKGVQFKRFFCLKISFELNPLKKAKHSCTVARPIGISKVHHKYVVSYECSCSRVCSIKYTFVLFEPIFKVMAGSMKEL